MSNIFQAVKNAVTARQAAEYYGLDVGTNGMCRCPFHNDRNPSMKISDGFYCFGCGASGDVITFTSKMYGLKPYDAAKKLAADFNIPCDAGSEVKPAAINSFSVSLRDAKKIFMDILCRYLSLLRSWKEEYAPANRYNPRWHPLFIEALQEEAFAAELLEEYIMADDAQKENLLIDYGKKVLSYQQRIKKAAGGAA